MRIRNFALILSAAGLATATGVGVKQWLDGQRAVLLSQAKPAEKPLPRVLVAAKDLPVGAFVRPEMLRWQAWPEAALAPVYAVEGQKRLEDYAGALVRERLVAGEPLSDAKVVTPGASGFLAAVLQPGARAVTVAVNATSGIAGFVFPGDRVDLILTHSFTQEGDQSRERRASETVLRDIRVLAIDQKLDNAKPGEAMPARTATLEVTPRQSETIALVQDMGKLSLSLRSLAREEDEAAPTRSATTDSDVSRLLPPLQSNRREVAVLRGRASATVAAPAAAQPASAQPASTMGAPR